MESLMLRAALLAIAISAVAGATLTGARAQNVDAIKARKALLKEMAEATKAPGAMMKQEIPFDPAPVKAALARFQANAPKIAALFPDDSKTGGETEALPSIWENKADFMQRFEKLVAAAKAAETSITDEIAFQEEWPKVVGNCGACHKQYRKDK